MDEVDVPPSFLCPITLQCMVDPVTDVDGHTYERTAITEHFRIRGARSPMTNNSLRSSTLTPNRALKDAIETWLNEKNRIHDTSKSSASSATPAAKTSVFYAKQFTFDNTTIAMDETFHNRMIRLLDGFKENISVEQRIEFMLLFVLVTTSILLNPSYSVNTMFYFAAFLLFVNYQAFRVFLRIEHVGILLFVLILLEWMLGSYFSLSKHISMLAILFGISLTPRWIVGNTVQLQEPYQHNIVMILVVHVTILLYVTLFSWYSDGKPFVTTLLYFLFSISLTVTPSVLFLANHKMAKLLPTPSLQKKIINGVLYQFGHCLLNTTWLVMVCTASTSLQYPMLLSYGVPSGVILLCVEGTRRLWNVPSSSSSSSSSSLATSLASLVTSSSEEGITHYLIDYTRYRSLSYLPLLCLLFETAVGPRSAIFFCFTLKRSLLLSTWTLSRCILLITLNFILLLTGNLSIHDMLLHSFIHNQKYVMDVLFWVWIMDNKASVVSHAMPNERLIYIDIAKWTVCEVIVEMWDATKIALREKDTDAKIAFPAHDLNGQVICELRCTSS